MSTGNFITIDERAYRYIRQFSIKNVTDALVELLTNADDAYARGGITNRTFIITYCGLTHTIYVVDNATGLRADMMEKCFMQVGNYTSSDGSRGFFSRGAKDVSILGDVTFDSIKDGYYSQTFITANAYAGINITDQIVDDAIRTNLNIPGNGLSVNIKLLPTFYITNIDQFIYDITNRASIRHILDNPNNIVRFLHIDNPEKIATEYMIKYVYPVGKLLLDVEFEVPDYPGVNARFTVYKADVPIPQPQKENQLEFGFLIESENAIHEVSTIDSRFRWHPYMNYVYGSLKCDYINALLRMMDDVGVTNENPSSIIDPSRYAGLNRDHPFIEALMRIPKVRLDYVLRQLDNAASKRSVQMNEFNEIMDQLEQYGLTIFDDVPDNQPWIENYDSELVKAIQNDRQKYVNIERNFMLESNEIIIDTSEEMQKLKDAINATHQNYVYLMNDSGSVIEVPTDGIEINSPTLSSSEVKGFYDYLLKNVNPNDFTKNPYIYQMSSDGTLVKLFIFNQGEMGDITEDEMQSIKSKNKIINLHFTKDINMAYRYNISISNGKIDITISLNDPIVSQYLLASKTNPDGSINDADVTFTMTSLQNIGNNKSYIFMSELFIEIFSRIILYGKAQSGQVNITSDTTSALMHIMDAHYETVAALIQVPITNIFQKYYNENSVRLINVFVDTIAKSLSIDSAMLADVKDELLVNYQKLF